MLRHPAVRSILLGLACLLPAGAETRLARVFDDHIHPNAAGAQAIATATHRLIMALDKTHSSPQPEQR